ncbi:hypothetical protein SDC9_156143 [bioreactor metagenome]|uniref:NodB homology domain-containing protein n=1 Tax=bioreactor metagenome TaxID=1076179 RepID=A0A645F3W6_9ZZZZ
MKKTEVLFFFDTEDFTSNRSADAIKGLADLMTSEGVTGHFAVVGLLARQLKAWQREDVIESLGPHIIGTHTYGHSLHPDILNNLILKTLMPHSKMSPNMKIRRLQIFNRFLILITSISPVRPETAKAMLQCIIMRKGAFLFTAIPL